MQAEMARNAKTPTVTSATSATCLKPSVPMIRIEAPKKTEEVPMKPISRLEEKQRNRMTASTNGNGVMKAPVRETVVNFDYSDEPVPPSHYCCGKLKINKTCRIVGCLSFIGFFINLVLYFMGISRLGLNGYIEAFLLIFDFIAVITLMCGVSKQKSGLLKPYLFYNTIWSMGLIILFTVFIWHWIKGTHNVARNILENLHSLHSPPDEYRYKRHESSTTAIIVTMLVVAAMTTVIIVECLFLHIVYRTFQHFAYREEKKREEIDKKERL